VLLFLSFLSPIFSRFVKDRAITGQKRPGTRKQTQTQTRALRSYDTKLHTFGGPSSLTLTRSRQTPPLKRNPKSERRQKWPGGVDWNAHVVLEDLRSSLRPQNARAGRAQRIRNVALIGNKQTRGTAMYSLRINAT
jgi:hypothetical protein